MPDNPCPQMGRPLPIQCETWTTHQWVIKFLIEYHLIDFLFLFLFEIISADC